MSVVQRLARLFGRGETESKAFTLTGHEAIGLFAGLSVRSGVTVTSATALRVPAVAAAVGLISEACGDLPFKLHDRATREAQKGHLAYELIHGEANPWTSAEELREQLTRDALLCGHGFAQVATELKRAADPIWQERASNSAWRKTPAGKAARRTTRAVPNLNLAGYSDDEKKAREEEQRYISNTRIRLAKQKLSDTEIEAKIEAGLEKRRQKELRAA